MTVSEVGYMGSALLFTYAFGKFCNGFLSDYVNVRRFISFALLASALINVTLGFSSNAVLFIVLWGINGWFQSMGSAPSCVSVFQWFPPSNRGSMYSIWAGSHNIGEGLVFVFSSLIVSVWGWRMGFITPGILSIVVAIVIYIYLKDRPKALGLPIPSEIFNETEKFQYQTKSTWHSQLIVVKNPIIWIIAISCAFMYVSRYAINSWAIFFLQEAKGYSLDEAGVAMGIYPILGLCGAVLSGIISDRFFKSDRQVTTLLYGLCNVVGMIILFYSRDSALLDTIALGLFGFGIGGLIVFLGGLIASDLAPKDSIGTVKGFIGLFAYIGASIQEVLSGWLIKERFESGIKHYDFDQAINMWIAAGILSIFLSMIISPLVKRLKL